MKKIISLLSLSILITICLVGKVYASSMCSVNLQAQATNNGEISVNVVLSNIQDEKGIYGLSAILQYDTGSLEYLRMEEQQGWDGVSYNEANGRLAITRKGKEFAKSNQTVFKIIFRKKVENKSNVGINLTNITVTNSSKDNKLVNASTTINIGTNNNSGSEENNNPETGNGNNNSGSSSSNNNNNNSNNNSGSSSSNNNNNNNNRPGSNSENNNNNSGNNGTNSNNNNTENNNNDNPENNESDDINNNTKEENSNENNEVPDNSINEENDKDANAVNGNLPNTGNKANTIALVVVGIALLAIIVTVLYIKIRKINKMENK